MVVTHTMVTAPSRGGTLLQGGNYKALFAQLHKAKTLAYLLDGVLLPIGSAADMPDEDVIERCAFYEILPLQSLDILTIPGIPART